MASRHARPEGRAYARLLVRATAVIGRRRPDLQVGRPSTWRWRAALAGAVLMVASLALACTRPRADDGMIVVAMANAAVNLDPRVGTDEASQKAHQLLYDPLMRIDDQLKPVPALAESLEIEPDELTYVVRLRHDVRFHNGRELTSEDVAYTFNSFLDPAFRGRSAGYRILASVKATSRYTVVFTLKERSAQ